MENLHHRRIVPSPICPLCKLEVETLEHTLLLCSWTATVWKAAPLHLRISRFGLTRLEEWICNIKRNPVTSGTFNYIAVVLWSIWKERNRSIFNHQIPRSQETIARAEAFVESFTKLNKKSTSKNRSEALSEVWCPPPPGSIRINLDASFEPDPDRNEALSEERETPRHRAAIAGVCRDHRGFLVDGFAKTVDASSPLHAEAIAMEETLKFARSRRFLSPQVHSDCLPLVHALKTSTELSWELEPLLNRARAHLNHLPGLTLAHCNRSMNRPADWIAKACRTSSLPQHWISNPPPPLFDLLCTDAMSVIFPCIK
ncbi:hypothetical protein ACJRO7_011263 [Eucalyptus globulus]|uniref:RNase H type-1 domain-containing protein n=1 Tax=Eucalyptus globulus TaxID=34317 RepID=A0ABD3LFI0_EUCGL